MEFISEIRDIDDNAFVTLEELKMKGADTNTLTLWFRHLTVNAYGMFFIRSAVVTPEVDNYENEVIDIRKQLLRHFMGRYHKDVLTELNKRINIDGVAFKETLGEVEVIYDVYPFRYFVTGRKNNLNYMFPIPARVRSMDELPAHEVYFRLSDVGALIPEPEKGNLIDQTEAPLPEQLGPSRVTIDDETYVRLDKLFSDASSRGVAKEACEEIGARRLYIYEYFPIRTLIHDDELQDHGFPEADDQVTFVRCDDLYCPIDTPSDDERYHYEESPEGFIFKVEKIFHLVPFSLVDFDRHYAKLSNVIKLGLLPEPVKAEPQIEAIQQDVRAAGSMPDAKTARKQGQVKAMLEAKDRSLQATHLVTKWIVESAFQPGEVTKIKVQDFLGQNTFGYGETQIFKDVWKAIPYSNKSSGGRPPGK